LGRLIDVCNAIEYAHSRGVVHRDLKPGNVMLGKYGETLVVDWGLAKAAGQSEASMAHAKISEEGSLTLSRVSESAPTQMGSAIGTPQYMSPEQAAGRLDVIGPQSDVYSLGATLYCLLAGEPPLSRDARDLGELLRRVQSGDIRPPRSIKPDIPKALEAVCLKAMAVDLDKRYQSPKALADDLEHWLANEPVSARRETFAERAARWARRHRTWIQAGVSAIVVIMIVAVVFSFLLNAEKNRAEESFLQARATVDQFFTDISENRLLDVPGLQPLREELLKSALAYYEDFAQQRADDRSVRAELGKTHYRIGLIVGRIGSKPKSLESLSEAQAIQEQVIEEGSAPAEAYADLANTHNAIGDLQLQMGNDRQALSRFQSALKLREELVAGHPEDDQLRRKLANSHNNVAVTLARLQDNAKAEAHYAQANKIREQLAGDHPDNAQFKTDLARGHYNFGLYKRDRNEMDAALESFRRAAEAYEQVAKLETSKIEPRRELAIVHRVIGDVQADLTKFDLAAASYDKARGLAEALARRNPFLVELRADVAAILSNIGHLNRKRDKTDDALRAFEQAEAILQGLVEDDPTVARYQKDLAATKVQVGIVLLNKDQLASARKQFDAGLKTYQMLAESNPQDRALQVAIAQAHVDIGLIHRSHADHETALVTFRESVKIYEKLLQNSPSIDAEAGLADALLNVAVELRGLSRIEDALTELERARSVQTKLVQAHPDVIKYRHVETEIDYLIGLLRFERAQQGLESSDADVKLRAGEELNAALAMYRRVRDQRARLVKELPGNLYYENLLGVALDELAVVLATHGENEEALAMSREATPYLQRVVSNAPEQVEYLGNLRAHYRKRAHFERAAGKFDKAAELSIESRKISSQNAEALYYAAVDLVATAAAANNSTDIPKTQSALWLDQAADTVEEAVKAGEDVEKLKDDPNLAPLRDHAKFKALIKDQRRMR
jgi:serine/threonine-protein kinase